MSVSLSLTLTPEPFLGPVLLSPPSFHNWLLLKFFAWILVIVCQRRIETLAHQCAWLDVGASLSARLLPLGLDWAGTDICGRRFLQSFNIFISFQETDVLKKAEEEAPPSIPSLISTIRQLSITKIALGKLKCPLNTWMQLETLRLSEVRKRKTNTIRYHLHVESKIWH